MAWKGHSNSECETECAECAIIVESVAILSGARRRCRKVLDSATKKDVSTELNVPCRTLTQRNELLNSTLEKSIMRRSRDFLSYPLEFFILSYESSQEAQNNRYRERSDWFRNGSTMREEPYVLWERLSNNQEVSAPWTISNESQW